MTTTFERREGPDSSRDRFPSASSRSLQSRFNVNVQRQPWRPPQVHSAGMYWGHVQSFIITLLTSASLDSMKLREHRSRPSRPSANANILFAMSTCSSREPLGIPLMGTQFHTVHLRATVVRSPSPPTSMQRTHPRPPAGRRAGRLLGSHPQCVTSRRYLLRVGRRPSNEG